MKSCIEKGHVALYVRSFVSTSSALEIILMSALAYHFQGFMGEEASMALVFEKARSQAPCVLILEDLDSLITDHNRSFFLNQIDGLDSNDGLLVIGTTNHFEKLDPALSTRPSRFDRK
jgi:transitional endoplasmic reticulum ATPase